MKPAGDAEAIEHLVDLPAAPVLPADDPHGLDDGRRRPRPLAEVLAERGVELLVPGTGRLGEHGVDDAESEAA